tara:strand:+ start:6 stop:749 length:744 start_codon:yes stop_codon:yes gene_type:complete
MRYIKLNELISKFFFKFPFFVIIFIITYGVLYFFSPIYTYEYEIKNSISPARIAGEVFENESKLLARVNNPLFNSKFKDAGGNSIYNPYLNKAKMLEVSFKGDNKEDLYEDTQTFINQLQIIFDEIKAQHLNRDRSVELYKAEINKLNEISNFTNNVKGKASSSLDAAMKALIEINKDANLSGQRVKVGEKLISIQYDEEIRWLYTMSLSDVKESSYTSILLIVSFAFTMFLYFFILLFRYGQKFDK